MKRFVLIVSLVFLVLGGVPAFSQQEPPPGRVVIDFWHAFRGALGDTLQTLVNEFNASQDKYWVSAVYKGSYAETMEAAIAAFQAGQPPHIVQVFEVGTATMMAAEGVIYPVDQLFKDTGVAVNPEDFIPAVKGYYSFSDGRMAAMPFNSSTAVFWYNKDMFRAAGLDPDNPPRTWAEVREAAAKIKAAGVAEIPLSCAWFTWTQFEQFGAIHNVPFATRGNGFDGLDAELTLDHPLYVRHIQNLVEMSKEGLFVYGGRDSAPDALFPAGQAAMLIASSALLARVKREAQFEWGITYLPYYDDFVASPFNSIIGGAALWVLRHPKASPEEYKGVAEFFRFLSSPEKAGWWHIQTGYVPVTYGGYEYAKAQGYYEANPGADIAVLQLARTPTTENTRGLRLGYLPAIRVVIYEEIEKALQGEQTAAQALKNVVRRGNELLREFEDLYKK